MNDQVSNDLTADHHTPTNDSELKALVEHMVTALVDNPSEIEIREIVGTQSSCIELRVAKQDLGKIIGRQGATAMAMRTVLNAVSSKIRKRTILEIIE